MRAIMGILVHVTCGGILNAKQSDFAGYGNGLLNKFLKLDEGFSWH